VVVCLASATSILADEVTLTDGGKLVGTIQSMVDGKLTVKGTAAGDITVPYDKVASFMSDGPVELVFKDGTVLKQRVLVGESGSVTISPEGVVQGEPFSLTDIAKINPPPVKWTGSITGSYIINRGNSESSQGSVLVSIERRSEIDRIRLNGIYNGGRNTDQTTGDTSTTARYIELFAQYDYFFTKKLYGWVNGRWQKDGPADLDERITTGAGPGYQWVDKEDLSFSTEAGLVWFIEHFSNATPDDDHLAARIAYILTSTITDGVKFANSVEWYPSLESHYDQYLLAKAGLTLNLTDSMVAEAKVLYQWDSEPAEGKKTVDVSYLFGLGWTF
jgi:putative salt-induced outer membrane protein YdiY